MEIPQYFGFLGTPWSAVHFIEAETPTSKILDVLNDFDGLPDVATRASVLTMLLRIPGKDDIYPIICRLLALRLSKLRASQQLDSYSKPYHVLDRPRYSHFDTICDDVEVTRMREPSQIQFVRRKVSPSWEELELASNLMKSINRDSWPVKRTILLADDLPYGPPRGKTREEEMEGWKTKREQRVKAKANKQKQFKIRERCRLVHLRIQKQQITREYKERKRLMRREREMLEWPKDPCVI